MHRMQLLAGLLTAVTLSACANAPAVDAQAEEQQIRQIDEQWGQAMANRDLDGVVAIYAPDAYFLVPNAPSAQGTEAIRQHWQELFSLPNVDLSIEPTQITIAEAGDMAYDMGTYNLAFDGEDGRVQDNGKYLVVWRKLDGEWKVVSDMFSSNLPQ